MQWHKGIRALLITLSAAVLVAMGLGACSVDRQKDPNAPKEIVLLTVSQTCDYCAKHTETFKAAMAKAGIKVRVVVNEFNAADQAQQVNQAISTQPDAMVVWPADSRAIIPSLVRIKKAGIPVVVSNSYPQTPDTSLWTAYTGPNDIANGEAAAHAMVDAFEAKGFGDTGNIVALVGPPGLRPPSTDSRAFKPSSPSSPQASRLSDLNRATGIRLWPLPPRPRCSPSTGETICGGCTPRPTT